MAKNDAATIDEYLAALPEDRRAALASVRAVIRKNLPGGYEEGMGFGMISYTLPLAKYPDTYNGQPLCYAGLAAQKNHSALYLTGAYADPKIEKALRDGFAKAGKRLDMGKSCIRFKAAEDLPLEVIGKAVAALPPEAFIERHEKARAGGSAKKKTAKQIATAKKAAKAR
jgi:hypothetical protein